MKSHDSLGYIDHYLIAQANEKVFRQALRKDYSAIMTANS